MTKYIQSNDTILMVILLGAINFIFSNLIFVVLFALMFKFLPDAKIKWHHVWIGAVVTSLLFSLGKTGLAFYFGKAEPGSGYGAAGSIILILLWVSYSSMILFFGAEFTKTYADYYTGDVPPKENAEKEKITAREKEL